MTFVTTITVVTIGTLRVKGCSAMLNNYNDVYTVVHVYSCTCVYNINNDNSIATVW